MNKCPCLRSKTGIDEIFFIYKNINFLHTILATKHKQIRYREQHPSIKIVQRRMLIPGVLKRNEQDNEIE
ncbi:hypothetical protein NQ314_008473 [Rhamnusium bicolor]|uniref:Uncharacterized protein n=1 Tax=Rhamnusium bicolor TaxID=1586634 RepID=A0AAV8YA57_9CUCU|nr:hypothetical protein NQ314_008473 [Rhamnusium bicolor]